MLMKKCVVLVAAGGLLIGASVAGAADDRVSATNKGSLLIYPAVEVKWNAAGAVTQDTFLTLTNDFDDDVDVQFYFINGDEPLAPVLIGDPPMLVERGHLGWNWVDCQIELTGNQPTYWSALTGEPNGCQDWTILDPGFPPGRPDPEGPAGSRYLRGYVLAWAVNSAGEEIRWNHLKGDATTVNYEQGYAFEYNAYAFRALTANHGEESDAYPGELQLDGSEYDYVFDKLLFNFYASGSQALSRGGNVATIDTDVTVFPVSVDLRQETEGPVVTKVRFDIWNENETRFSNTERCISCWDQALLSDYIAPNHFLVNFLQTDAGKARLDGLASQECDVLLCDLLDVFTPNCSTNAAILGIATKLIAFSGAGTGVAASSVNMAGMDTESATIQYDIIAPPGEVIGDEDSVDVPGSLEKPNRGGIRAESILKQ
jgi:hypothetical protein